MAATVWRRILLWGGVGCIVASICFAAPSARVVASTATAAPTHDQAVGTLQLYYKYINAKDYRKAYNLRSSGLQRRQSYGSFAAGFGRMATNDLKVLGTSASGAQTVVRVELKATLNDGGRQTFRGTYTVGRESGRFRITGANLSAV